MSLIEAFKAIDFKLLIILNQKISNSLFDLIMPIITNEDYWVIPILCLIIYLLFFGQKKGKIVLFLLIISLGINDYICASIIKPTIARLRPSHEFLEYVNLLVPKGGKWSMPSNHASNMFVLATIISNFYSKTKAGIFLIAILVSFSRVYVGVHYPMDVIVGASIGTIIATIIISLWSFLKLNQLKKDKDWIIY